MKESKIYIMELIRDGDYLGEVTGEVVYVYRSERTAVPYQEGFASFETSELHKIEVDPLVELITEEGKVISDFALTATEIKTIKEKAMKGNL
jgi:hypothetical protein